MHIGYRCAWWHFRRCIAFPTPVLCRLEHHNLRILQEKLEDQSGQPLSKENILQEYHQSLRVSHFQEGQTPGVRIGKKDTSSASITSGYPKEYKSQSTVVAYCVCPTYLYKPSFDYTGVSIGNKRSEAVT